jgi:hypothetical protein
MTGSASKGQPARRLPRGVRNNNPGNIRKGPDKWQGAVPGEDADFVTFASAEMGIRALARLILTYQKRYNLNSVRSLITRWAPPSENNTPAYVMAVANAVGVQPEARIDVDDFAVMKPFVEGVIAHENAGYQYPDAVIDGALRRAGIVDAPAPKLLASTSNKTALITSTAAGGAGLVETVKTFGEVREQLEPFAYYSRIIALIVVLLAVAGAGFTMWSHFDRKRKGLL